MVHIDIRTKRAAIIEASGDTDLIAGQIAAAVGVIYSKLCDTGTAAGDTFRDAITAMLADDGEVWEESRKARLNGDGYGVVYEAPAAEGG